MKGAQAYRCRECGNETIMPSRRRDPLPCGCGADTWEETVRIADDTRWSIEFGYGGRGSGGRVIDAEGDPLEVTDGGGSA